MVAALLHSSYSQHQNIDEAAFLLAFGAVKERVVVGFQNLTTEWRMWFEL